MIRKMDELQPSDYADIGLKSGLEIHQQLDTEKKLFCRCPVMPYSDEFDAQILRHMRPTLSELGEYDGTALMEFKTKKNIIYHINKNTVCTYEIDDTPPFELNRQALLTALEITMLLRCKLVSEVHIQRKQYLDGSIPAGFQRTTILGVDGWVPYRGRKIGIIQLGLEEDACREVSDEGHRRVYLTDRLGIPLIETVTAPEMKTPEEVAGVAQVLSSLARATGKVRRGIGAARQDVNVSVEGGRRVEIKGVARIPEIPLLVHNEAFRQVTLLEIKKELAERGISREGFEYRSLEVTEEMKGTAFNPILRAVSDGMTVKAVVLKGYRGILEVPTQPGRTFASEISDRVRVIACLDRLPNIVFRNAKGSAPSNMEWDRIAMKAGAGENDALVLVWGPEEDAETAVNEIAIRAEEALDGVCNETRQSFPDGTNGFERILPGPNRMYPDTDLAPIAISRETIESVRAKLPERPWERRERYEKAGIPKESARQLSSSELRGVFDRALKDTNYEPRKLAHFFLSSLNHVKKRTGTGIIPEERLLDVLVSARKGEVPLNAAAYVLEELEADPGRRPEEVIRNISVPEDGELRRAADEKLRSLDVFDMDRVSLERYIIGLVRREYGGIPGGTRVKEAVRDSISGTA